MINMWCWGMSILIRSDKKVKFEYEKRNQQPTHPIHTATSIFWNLEKTLILEKIERGRKRGDRGWHGWLASLIQWTWVCANWEIVKDREAWHTAGHGVAKSQTRLTDWTTTSIFIILCDFLKMHGFGSGILAIFLNTLLHVYITWFAWPKSYLPKVVSLTMLEKYFWKRQCPYE